MSNARILDSMLRIENSYGTGEGPVSPCRWRKRFAVLPGLAHSTPLGIHRRRMWEAVDQFLAS